MFGPLGLRELGLLAGVMLSACTESEPRSFVLPEVPGAKSALLGLLTGAGLRVVARDLEEDDWPILISEELDGDAEAALTDLSIRFYEGSLAELTLRSGPIAAGPGAPLPARGRWADFQRTVELDLDSGWQPDQLSTSFRDFESAEFREAGTCAMPVLLANVELDSSSYVSAAARLGRDAVMLQDAKQLSVVNEAGASSLYSVWPTLESSVGDSITALYTWGEDLLIAGCTGSVPTLTRLRSGEEPGTLGIQGLPGCPARLSAFEDQLQALVSTHEVFVYDSSLETWTQLGTFPEAVYAPRFIAVGRDRAMAFTTTLPDLMTLLRRHLAMSMDRDGARITTIPVIEDRDLEISNPVIVGDEVAIAWTDAVTAVKIAMGQFDGPWRVQKERKVRAVLALAPHEGGVACAGRRGQFQEVRVYDPETAPDCEILAAVPIPQATEIVALGEGRFAIAGHSNFELVDQTRRQLVSLTALR